MDYLLLSSHLAQKFRCCETLTRDSRRSQAIRKEISASSNIGNDNNTTTHRQFRRSHSDVTYTPSPTMRAECSPSVFVDLQGAAHGDQHCCGPSQWSDASRSGTMTCWRAARRELPHSALERRPDAFAKGPRTGFIRTVRRREFRGRESGGVSTTAGYGHCWSW